MGQKNKNALDSDSESLANSDVYQILKDQNLLESDKCRKKKKQTVEKVDLKLTTKDLDNLSDTEVLEILFNPDKHIKQRNAITQLRATKKFHEDKAQLN